MITEAMFLELTQALKAEIREASKQRREINLVDGKLEDEGEKFYYSFHVEEDVYIPEDAQIELRIDGNSSNGSIISVLPSAVFLALDSNLGKEISQAKLVTESSFVLKQLLNRVEELQDSYKNGEMPPLCNELFAQHLQTAQVVEISFPSLDPHQNMAVRKVCSLPVCFVWGPPGTGKTKTLAFAAKALEAMGEKILIMAHSNAAVDAAALKIVEAFEDNPILKEGLILRYGIPYLPDVRHHPYISAEGILKKSYPGKIARLLQLQRMLAELRESKSEAKTVKIQEVEEELKDLGDWKKRESENLLSRAKIVLCTLSKMVIDGQVRAKKFDTVIIDEVSMAYIPSVLVGASLATKRIALFGDFKQLPPISLAAEKELIAKRWLERDIFDEAGVVEKVTKGEKDHRLVMLKTQYRMHPEIRKVVSLYSYHGNLDDKINIAQEVVSFTNAQPLSGEPIVLVDTSRLLPILYQGPHFESYFNPISALLAIQIAFDLLSHTKQKELVGIITPYKAQAAFIRTLVTEVKLSQLLIASTVHRFQGQEKGLIIYDIPDSFPKKKPSEFISTDELSERLHNVAVSRAKGKIVELANLRFLTQATPNYCSLDRLQKIVGQHGKQVTSPSIFNLLKGIQGDSFSIQWFTNKQEEWNRAVLAFQQDLSNAQRQISIFWPSSSSDFNRYIPTKSMRVKIVNFSPKENANGISVGGLSPIFTPVKGNKSEGIFCIDQDIVWFIHWHYVHKRDITQPGLNLIAVRLKSRRAVNYLYPIFWPQVKKPEDKAIKEKWGWRCPKCGQPSMTMERGTYGYYALCCACRWKSKANLQHVNQWLQEMKQDCPKCGKRLKAIPSRKTFDIVIICPQERNHFMKRLQDVSL